MLKSSFIFLKSDAANDSAFLPPISPAAIAVRWCPKKTVCGAMMSLNQNVWNWPHMMSEIDVKKPEMNQRRNG